MRAHILCTVHAGAKLWTHLARAAHQPTWEKTTFWIQISYNKSTCIRKLFDVAIWLKSEINPNENTFLGLLISIPGRVAQILKHTIYEIHIMNNRNNFLCLGFKAAQKFKSYQYAWWTWPFSKVNENKLQKQACSNSSKLYCSPCWFIITIKTDVNYFATNTFRSHKQF